MPETIPTPRACPGGCGAPVAIERVPVEPTLYPRDGESVSDLALKRRVLDADGELHSCPPPSEGYLRARRLIRAKRHAQRDRERAVAAAAREAKLERERERAAARAAILAPAAPKIWAPGGRSA